MSKENYIIIRKIDRSMIGPASFLTLVIITCSFAIFMLFVEFKELMPNWFYCGFAIVLLLAMKLIYDTWSDAIEVYKVRARKVRS